MLKLASFQHAREEMCALRRMVACGHLLCVIEAKSAIASAKPPSIAPALSLGFAFYTFRASWPNPRRVTAARSRALLMWLGQYINK